jgi:hypothetical protein
MVRYRTVHYKTVHYIMVQHYKTIRGTKRYVTERYSYIRENVTKWYSCTKRCVIETVIPTHDITMHNYGLVGRLL